MITLHFVGADGTTRSLAAEEGANVMELASRNGVPGISADCGGCLSCGTCHAYVAPAIDGIRFDIPDAAF
jgi:2Fe-2S ferredoxin